jgi:uncharacterized protein YecT (DUF1311 family)
MLNSLQLVTAVLLFAIFLCARNLSPAQQTTSQKNPCDWAKTQRDMNQCSGEQYRKADTHLNNLYAKVMGLLEKDLAKNADDPEQKPYNELAIQKLRAAEKSWIQYRDLHCDAARHQFEGGSLSPMIWTDCMTTTTKHRIDDLKNAYGSPARKLK